MGRECFTCAFKNSTELSKEERQQLRDKARAAGDRWPRVPEMIFHCRLTGKQISQIDPACDQYTGDPHMEHLRKDIAIWAKNERQKLQNNGTTKS